MAKIFRQTARRFEENHGRRDGFKVMSDAAIMSAMGARSANPGGEAELNRGSHGDSKNRATDVLGRGSLNFDMRRLDPGQLSSLYHFHRHAEEMFMIVSGEATLRTPDGMSVLHPGDIAFFETGADGAHQLFNHGNEPCVYLDVRTFPGADIAEYPDSGRLLIVPTMERFDKATSSDYFEGEPSAAALREIFKQK
ncbi:MAG: cupin domain-containing protein [Alistipes sp.]|jgi:uncharacterized cupin superfamily protein|nr:cupin domain-containing protein [Alistipes sp.]